MRLLLLLAALPLARALLELEDARERVQVHRRRACDAPLRWRAGFSASQSLAALENESGAATWRVADGCAAAACWSRESVDLEGEELVLAAGEQDRAGGWVQVEVPLEIDGSLDASSAKSDALLRLAVIARFPEVSAGAAATIALTIGHLNLTASFGVSENDVLVTSSRNTSVVTELPCKETVTGSFREYEFAWSAKWLRWFVDGIMVAEEYIGHFTGDVDLGESTVVVDFSYSTARQDAQDTSLHNSLDPFRIKMLGLAAGDASDPYCHPRHRSELNCRSKNPWMPRLGSNQGYLSTEEVDDFIDEIATTLPSDLVRVEDLGKTLDGRQLRALCLGACHANSIAPQTLYTGMHHSREPISMMNLVYTIDLLVADYFNGDLDMVHLLLSRQLWFILIVNPDGYARNEQLRMWELHQTGQRKNARTGCADILDTGVDLNRNYDVCFNHDDIGSNPKACAEDYRGPHPFSEPETQAVRSIVEDRGLSFTAALNYHSYGRYFNIPFACESMGIPGGKNASVFEDLAREMARYNNFQYGQPWKDSNLYTVNGETSDWMWNAHGIFSMSPEVGPNFEVDSAPGFWPPKDQVPALSAELHYTNLYLAQVSGQVYNLKVTDLQIEPGKINFGFKVSNVGLRVGNSNVEVFVSPFVNGTGSSIITSIPAHTLGSMLDLKSTSELVTLPMSSPDAVNELYIVLRDALGCSMFRISATTVASGSIGDMRVTQTWQPILLPRCGMCEAFGEPNDSFSSANSSSLCSGIKDITALQAIRTRAARSKSTDKWTFPAVSSLTTSLDGSIGSRATTSTTNEKPSPSTTLTNAATTDSGSFLTASSILPFVGGTLVVVIVLLVWVTKRKNLCKKRDKNSNDKVVRQSKSAYSRVVVNDNSDEEDEVENDDTVVSSPADENGSDDAKLLERAATRETRSDQRASRRVRSPSPSRRSPSSTVTDDQIV